jgi:hypothetical protein
MEEKMSRKMLVKNSLLYSSAEEEKERFKIYWQYFYP